MFQKILIADDHDTVNRALEEMLEISIPVINRSQYCDDALLKIKSAIADRDKFDLLITDLVFKPDTRKENLKNGWELIATVRKLQPDLRIIVYSIEDQLYPIRKLYREDKINAYVIKGRDSMQQLWRAIKKVDSSPDSIRNEVLEKASRQQGVVQLDDIDLTLLKLLGSGLTIKEIIEVLAKEGISISLSSINKKLNTLRVQFDAKTNTHLIIMAKEAGII